MERMTKEKFKRVLQYFKYVCIKLNVYVKILLIYHFNISD